MYHIAQNGTQNSNIGTLSNKIATQNVSVTKNTEVVASNSATTAKKNNFMCFVTFDINVLSSASDGSTICTGLPAPIALSAYGETTKSFKVLVNSNGEMKISGTPSAGWVQGSVIYMI